MLLHTWFLPLFDIVFITKVYKSLLFEKLVIYIVFLLLQAGLMNLESLNLDSCRIDDEGLVNLAGHCSLSSLYLIFLCPCCTFNNSSVFNQWSVEAYAFESHMYCA